MLVRSIYCFMVALGCWQGTCHADSTILRPNVVIVITDDQGHGDLGCHGNPELKTPSIDELYSESIRLTDYHVSPTCSPTRGAFLTGHWTNRAGTWHTIAGRSMLRAEETTMAEVFRDSGYVTGMFGKWHLGDNYPYRPEDRGFDEVMRHGGGGVGQTPDYWDNAYFDGTYFHNGKPAPAKGFCTDVFFESAIEFIREQSRADKPFFTYVSTNAPHGPMHCPPQYSKPYEHLGTNTANFFGMIANIDNNVGRLRTLISELGIRENTIFIFTTDNGTSSGGKVFNSGMQGTKGSPFDGGHRVPFFLYWPGGGFDTAVDVAPITAHIDVLPTLIELCDLTPPRDVKFDGNSLVQLLADDASTQWPDRILITDSQRVLDPIKWKSSAVMTSKFRLINKNKLFDIKSDPGQNTNIADQYPEVVKRLQDRYESWWAELEPGFAKLTPIYLGDPAENPTRLTCHDWTTADATPWNQSLVRSGGNDKSNHGFWSVNVVQAGDYQISLRRWPSETGQPINASIDPGESVPGEKAYRTTPGKPLSIVSASISIAGVEASKTVSPKDQEITFDIKLIAGETRLKATFETSQGKAIGAYYADVTKK